MSLWVDRRGLLILLSDKHGSGRGGTVQGADVLGDHQNEERNKCAETERERELQKASSQWLDSSFFFFSVKFQ